MSPPIGPSYSSQQQLPQPSKSSLNNAQSTTTATATTSKPLVKSSTSIHANFWDSYEHQCVLQNQAPLQFLKQSLSVDAGTNLFIDADKIKFDTLKTDLITNRRI